MKSYTEEVLKIEPNTFYRFSFGKHIHLSDERMFREVGLNNQDIIMFFNYEQSKNTIEMFNLTTNSKVLDGDPEFWFARNQPEYVGRGFESMLDDDAVRLEKID